MTRRRRRQLVIMNDASTDGLGSVFFDAIVIMDEPNLYFF
jgi:hypothetical protein